ncbi:hypothetical protein [Methylobacterium soli]|uniref:Lipoprotein n=1 Tax=Methylobacterium soli TaxID=553447 RepID=A0A6L3SSH9_9HYPH|nr:hypothetical protein [Methylobacterium soli]KAB1076517.1 hypothetical protein F6X53_22695 [Methylobacterium soli]GJE44846.1 hypothetical protein AEGHOMDF_4037 [Methylobacterium soli]
MKRILIIGGLALVLGACNPEQVDTWCRTHTLDDVAFSRKTVDGMTAADKRKYLKILEEGAALCGWRPNR